VPNIGIYVSEPLHARLQRLKEHGVELSVSAVCQRGLEAAVEAEEKALRGDRLARLLARVKSAKTLAEQVEAEGDAAGRAWAEDVATLSEMKRISQLLETVRHNRLDASEAHVGKRSVRIEFVRWLGDGDIEPWGDESLPDSVPGEFFERASKPREGVGYMASAVVGFLEGVEAVLQVIEHSFEKERTEETIRQVRDRLATRVQRVRKGGTQQAPPGPKPA
jgi:hypothetical protein